jgi:hypothetical protein
MLYRLCCLKDTLGSGVVLEVQMVQHIDTRGHHEWRRTIVGIIILGRPGVLCAKVDIGSVNHHHIAFSNGYRFPLLLWYMIRSFGGRLIAISAPIKYVAVVRFWVEVKALLLGCSFAFLIDVSVSCIFIPNAAPLVFSSAATLGFSFSFHPSCLNALAAVGSGFRNVGTTSFMVVPFFNISFLWKTWNVHVMLE